MKWTFFIGAAILAAYILIASGAPPFPVALGIAGALVWSWRAKFSRTASK